MTVIALLKQNWWMLALRGAIAILFGICAFVWPTITVLAFVLLLAAFAFVEGVFALVGAFGWGLPGGQRVLMVLLGLLGIVVGIYAVSHPAIAAVTIVLWVGWWAIIAGIIQVVVAVEMRKLIENEWWAILGGLLSALFGILLLWRPIAGVLTLTWLFGVYAIVFGIVMLSLSLRLKSLPSGATG